MAGTMKFEQTNRRTKVYRDLTISDGWKTLFNKYPTKCAICNKWIGDNTKILWHIKDRIVIHKEECF
jgi:hypothetical protein